MAARSRTLAKGVTPAGGFVVAFQVPNINVAILKSGMLYNPTGAAVTASVLIETSTGGIVAWARTVSLAGAGFDTFSCWHVLEASDVIIVSTNSTSLHFWLSGALLLA